MNHTLRFGDVNLPCREVVVDDQTYLVPRGIARNHRNKSWQTKIKRAGKLVVSGNHSDSLCGGTEEALKAAVKLVIDSSDVQPSRTLKISNRVTLVWAFSGVNVLSMNALVYCAARKRATTIYLISHSKLIAHKTKDLQSKLVRAFVREYEEENDPATVTVGLLMKMEKDAANIMVSSDWKDFVEVGTEIANAHKIEVESEVV